MMATESRYSRRTVWVDCLHCDGQIKVEVEVTPGEEAVHYPTERAHPGSPPSLELIDEVDRRDGCRCEVDWGQLEFERRDQMMDEVARDERAAEEFAAERRMEEAMEDRYMGAP